VSERFHFEMPLRVRWSECDAQGIVFNAQVLAFLDHAANEYWRALALPYPEGLAVLGADVVLRACDLAFHAPARFDEALHVGLRLAELGRSSFVMQGRVRRGALLLYEARSRYVLVDRASSRPTPLPELLRSLLQDFESGRPVTELRCGDWKQLGALAGPIRQRVFVQEQGVPVELERDGRDAEPGVVHAVVCNRLGQALATGRLLPVAPGVGKIGRLAVLPAARGTGWGAMVLAGLLDAARAQGLTEVMLHAQADACGFYRRAGFQSTGPVFEEAGIAHQAMALSLLSR
jgi:YbgC/YbaW family acyl-CoA thioester hydrolase